MLPQHSRHVDRVPTSSRHAATGKILGCDVTSRVQVRVKLEATCLTMKATPGAPVVAGNVPAATARLRGVPRVYRNHRTTALLSFVLDKSAQLRKAPSVNPARSFSLALNLCVRADARQILDHDYCTRFNRAHNLLGQYVIAVFAKSHMTSPQLTEMPSRRRGTFCLKRTPQPEILVLDFAPTRLTQKLSSRCHSRLDQPQVNTNNLARCRRRGCVERNRNVQVPFTVLEQQVGTVNCATYVLFNVVGYGKRNRLTTTSCRKLHNARRPIHFDCMHVEPRRAACRHRALDLAPSLLPGCYTAQRFCSLDARLVNVITHQRGVGGFYSVVGCVVQFRSIRDAVSPADRGGQVEGSRERSGRFRKQKSLARGWFQRESDRAPHVTILPYRWRLSNAVATSSPL